MSCTLYWKKVINNGERIGNHILRNALEERFGLPCRVYDIHIDYFNGLLDAGIIESKIILEAISNHGEIEIYQEC